MDIRSFLRSITPITLLEKYRSFKKKRTNSQLSKDLKAGNVITEEELFGDLQNLGISLNDSILVHCSMSKIGFLKDGPHTLINALKKAVGAEGNILMPSSPNKSLQLDYVRTHASFEVNNTHSAMGIISETFRKLPGVVRSLNPVEPICAMGPMAEWLSEGHAGELTSYTKNSPFARLTEINGKILYVGVTLDNAGTSLHVLEDCVENFKYPVYNDQVFEQAIIDANGHEKMVKIKVHNPEFSAKRKCDLLLPMFKKHGVYLEGKIGKAKTLVFDAKKMLEVMISEYESNGITMYTPNGEEI